ncbi:MAG: DUF2269 family protein [Thermoleophilaceae bacterium]|nr:DUF2269 family protein [Thermoleophilaceae bacterium]
MYEALLVVHILAVIITFGVTFTYPVWEVAARRDGARSIPYYLRVNRMLDRRVTSPGVGVVLLAGIGLVLVGGFSFGDPWISAALLIVIVLGGLAGAFFIPNATKLIELAERDIAAAGSGEVTLSEEFERGAKLRARVGGFAGLLVVVALVLMVVKP